MGKLDLRCTFVSTSAFEQEHGKIHGHLPESFKVHEVFTFSKQQTVVSVSTLYFDWSKASNNVISTEVVLYSESCNVEMTSSHTDVLRAEDTFLTSDFPDISMPMLGMTGILRGVWLGGMGSQIWTCGVKCY